MDGANCTENANEDNQYHVNEVSYLDSNDKFNAISIYIVTIANCSATEVDSLSRDINKNFDENQINYMDTDSDANNKTEQEDDVHVEHVHGYSENNDNVDGE